MADFVTLRSRACLTFTVADNAVAEACALAFNETATVRQRQRIAASDGDPYVFDRHSTWTIEPSQRTMCWLGRMGSSHLQQAESPLASRLVSDIGVTSGVGYSERRPSTRAAVGQRANPESQWRGRGTMRATGIGARSSWRPSAPPNASATTPAATSSAAGWTHESGAARSWDVKAFEDGGSFANWGAARNGPPRSVE